MRDVARHRILVVRGDGHGERERGAEGDGHRKHQGGNQRRLKSDDGCEARVRSCDRLGHDEWNSWRPVGGRRRGETGRQEAGGQQPWGGAHPRRPASQQRAEGDAGDEGRHHRAERKGGGSEHESENAGPCDLQNQRHAARHRHCHYRGQGRGARGEGRGLFRPEARGARLRPVPSRGILARLLAPRPSLLDPPSGKPPGEPGRDDVERDPDRRRVAHAESGQQHESAEDRARRGADRIRCVDQSGIASCSRRRTRMPPDHERKGRAHRNGRHRDDEQRARHAGQREARTAVAIRVRGRQDRLEEFELERQRRGQAGNRELHEGIRTQRGAAVEPSARTAGKRGADGKSAHERGQHGARGSDRVPHEKREEPSPGDLVDQSGRARAGEGEIDHAVIRRL